MVPLAFGDGADIPGTPLAPCIVEGKRMPHTALQILFATDFSDGAEPAGQVALDLARRTGAGLHVLHVTRHGWEDEMAEVLRDHVQRFSGVPVTAVVETGSAAERIVSYAERQGLDLVVLGTHGRTGFTRALLGSVAERVARTAHCPVMTVPRDPHAPGLHPRASADQAGEGEPPTPPTICLVCQAASDELICQPCRERIRGEAREPRPQEAAKLLV
jgi:nucleotide-binding universal stress UspA family protein